MQSITLDALWPANAVMVQRPFDDALDWLPKTCDFCERMSAAALLLTGSLPIICHRAGATPEGLELLRECGFRLPREILTYETLAEMRGIIAGQVLRGRKIGITFGAARPPAPREAMVNDPEVVSALNDKAQLADWLPPDGTPERTCVSPGELDAALASDRLAFPLVLKAAARIGSGGGFDVAICRNPAELAAARQALAKAETIVIEDYLPFTHNWCLHFAISDDAVTYVGATEQISDARGKYLGNWCGDAVPGSRAIALGQHAAEAGRERGYRGFLGADVGETADGHVAAFDLNFRNNGSTPQVISQRAIGAQLGATCSRFAPGIFFAGTYAEMLLRLRYYAGLSRVLPLLTFDTAQLGEANARPACNLLVIGPARDAILETLEVLEGDGFQVTPDWIAHDAPVADAPPRRS